LIVPAILAAGGLWFNAQQRDREQKLANERAQDEALQAYFDQMGQLLLDKDTQLRQSKEDDEVRTLVRAWTLTVLQRLDRRRKRTVVQFLYEAGLIYKEQTVVSLKQTSLDGVDLFKADLNRANLSGAKLTYADLRWANLSGANLKEALLNGASMDTANLSEADLFGTRLLHTDLRWANLSGANLERAELSMANLGGANLYDARRITNEELERQALSLAGATMPNGQKYEDWLKSRGEDGKNSEPWLYGAGRGEWGECRRVMACSRELLLHPHLHQECKIPSVTGIGSAIRMLPLDFALTTVLTTVWTAFGDKQRTFVIYGDSDLAYLSLFSGQGGIARQM
jgi:uncharacterized protein YjbI with pentapeptide repeats